MALKHPAETPTKNLPRDTFRRPIEVMASGPDGPVTPDSHSRTNGVIALQSGHRLPATTVHGGRHLEWEGSQWSAPTKWSLRGSDYVMDKVLWGLTPTDDVLDPASTGGMGSG